MSKHTIRIEWPAMIEQVKFFNATLRTYLLGPYETDTSPGPENGGDNTDVIPPLDSKPEEPQLVAPWEPPVPLKPGACVTRLNYLSSVCGTLTTFHASDWTKRQWLQSKQLEEQLVALLQELIGHRLQFDTGQLESKTRDNINTLSRHIKRTS